MQSYSETDISAMSDDGNNVASDEEDMVARTQFMAPSQRYAFRVIWYIKNIPGCWRFILGLLEKDEDLRKDLDQLYENKKAKQALRDRGFTI